MVVVYNILGMLLDEECLLDVSCCEWLLLL